LEGDSNVGDIWGPIAQRNAQATGWPVSQTGKTKSQKKFERTHSELAIQAEHRANPPTNQTPKSEETKKNEKILTENRSFESGGGRPIRKTAQATTSTMSEKIMAKRKKRCN